MSSEKKKITTADFERMANELEAMAEKVKQRPEINNHFAERLALLAKQMREDVDRLRKDEPPQS